MKQIVPGLATAIAGLFLWSAPAAAQRSVQDDVMKVDEAYRVARLKADTKAMEHILADNYKGTNQYGVIRNKAEIIALWKWFSVSSLTTDTAEVRVSGDTATVLGTQTENRTDRMLFTRVYVKGANGWQLLTGMQYLSPNATGAGAVPAAQPPATSAAEEEVRRAEEAYRIAKLKQDTAALAQILDPAFNETNQNGNSRNKAETIELWSGFSISSLTTDTAETRVTGDTAVVIGTQTENGYEHMLFTRVYVKRPAGWLLLASMQFRNPNAAGRSL